MANVTMTAGEIAKAITISVKIKGWQKFRFRVWVATRLIMLAARIGGFGFGFSDLEEGSVPKKATGRQG